jgi:hypothetical protein
MYLNSEMKQLALGSLGAAFLDCAWAMFSAHASTARATTSPFEWMVFSLCMCGSHFNGDGTGLTLYPNTS